MSMPQSFSSLLFWSLVKLPRWDHSHFFTRWRSVDFTVQEESPSQFHHVCFVTAMPFKPLTGRFSWARCLSLLVNQESDAPTIGRLVHTNEVMVLLGDKYFAKTLVSTARQIVESETKHIETRLEKNDIAGRQITERFVNFLKLKVGRQLARSSMTMT